ncbi:MAG: alcohol dehydrogenase catalytic domain-containing protein [Microbacterium sp.]
MIDTTIPVTMRAWVATTAEAPIEFVEVPVPQPGPDDVLIKVAAGGISPMLLKLLRMGRYGVLPTILGHETAGVVVAVGENVRGDLLGTRVRVHPMLSCRRCEYCLTDREQMCDQTAMIGAAAHGGVSPLYDEYHDGGLADYVRVPSWLVDEIPEGVSFEVAAKLHDLANAYRALNTARIPVGGTLVVTAATGAMATASLLLAPHVGVGRVILVGRARERLDQVAALAAGRVAVDVIATDDLADDWEQTGALTGAIRELVPAGPHAVLDFLAQGTGATQSLKSLRMGGTLVHMGGLHTPIDVPLRILMNYLWTVAGTRACTRGDVRAVLRLLESGALNADALITHRWPLTQADIAFDTLMSRREPIWMGVVTI